MTCWDDPEPGRGRKRGTVIVEGKGSAERSNRGLFRSGTSSRNPHQNTTGRNYRSGWPNCQAVLRLSGRAATEVELREKKSCIEDALAATRAAVEEGIVTGGSRTGKSDTSP